MTTPHNFTNTASRATLGASVSASGTTILLDDFFGFPAAPFTAALDYEQATEEVVLVTAVVGDTLTVTRGYDGSTAQSHSAGGSFVHTAVAKHFREAAAHTAATADVHGATGGLVGTEGAQTIRDKTIEALYALATSSSPAVTGEVPAGSTAKLLSLKYDGVEKVVADRDGNVSAANVTGQQGSFSGTVSGAVATTAGHLVRKDQLDAVGTALDGRLAAAEGTLAGATASNTASALMRRSATNSVSVSQVTGLATPTANADAANKGYVDSTAAAAPRMMYNNSALPASGTYTLSAADEGRILSQPNATGAVTVMLPASTVTTVPVGAAVDVVRYGAQALTIDSPAGVSILWNNASNGTNTISLNRYQVVRLLKIGGANWFAYDLTADSPAGGELLRADQTSNATATSTAPVNIAGINGTTFTVTSARKVQAILHVSSATGATGGELGRVGITINGITRRSQWYAGVAGSNGEVSPVVVWQETLPAGTYAVTVQVLRVSGGTSVTVGGSLLVVNDVGV